MLRIQVLWDVARGRSVVYRTIIHGAVSPKPGNTLRVVESEMIGGRY